MPHPQVDELQLAALHPEIVQRENFCKVNLADAVAALDQVVRDPLFRARITILGQLDDRP
ncbi:hypothetical protein D3C83_322150 [compost metagenome]